MSPWSQLRPLPLRLLRKPGPDLNPGTWWSKTLPFIPKKTCFYALTHLSLRLPFILLLSQETLTVLFSAFLLASPDLDSPPPFCGFNGRWCGGCSWLSPCLLVSVFFLPSLLFTSIFKGMRPCLSISPRPVSGLPSAPKNHPSVSPNKQTLSPFLEENGIFTSSCKTIGIWY